MCLLGLPAGVSSLCVEASLARAWVFIFFLSLLIVALHLLWSVEYTFLLLMSRRGPTSAAVQEANPL